MSNGNGHHWSKFSWRDWSADKALHPCSLAAKGFWIEMLCIMHEGTPIGHLTLGGKSASVRQMAANAYCTEKEAVRCLAELEDAGVFSRTDDGTIYCRRMVKDAAASEAGREHVAKRWNGQKPQPPNRGADRSPTSRPNGEAKSHPTRGPITKTSESESESLSKNLEGSRAREPVPPVNGICGQTIVDLAKALKTKPPPFTPSVAYQRSALEPAPTRPQPQDMPMTPEEQLAELHRMMAEEAAAKRANS